MLHYFPLEPLEQRYTKHLHKDITNYLQKNNINFVSYEPNINTDEIRTGAFLDANRTIMYKSEQIRMFAEQIEKGNVMSGDTLFFSDLQFPGIESIPYMCFFNKIELDIRGIYHAGSFTDTDYVRRMERWMKHFEEIVFDISNTVYVGSHFMKKELTERRIIDRNKVVVTGLPLDSSLVEFRKNTNVQKENIVVFNGRMDDEKQPNLFRLLEVYFGNKRKDWQFINTGKLKLPKKEYYELLAKAKIVVSFALQENFGYGIREAVYLGCIPVLPKRLVYKEAFDELCLYEHFDECWYKVDDFMDNYNEIMVDFRSTDILSVNDGIFKTWFGK